MINSSDAETARVAALARYEMLDTPREKEFDDIAALASAICETPIAVVNLVGADRQFFKAEVGLGVRETPFESSFCAKALLELGAFLSCLTRRRDARFDCNPLVTGEPHIRFYGGVLLKTDDGFPIGTVCVLDYTPRALTPVQVEALRVLARHAMTAMDLRLASRKSEREASRHRAIVDSATDFAVVVTDLDGLITDWSSGASLIFGWSEPEMVGQRIASIFTRDDVAAGVPEQEMVNAVQLGRGIDERWHERKGGDCFWASGELSPLRDAAGHHVGYVKVLRDRTEQHGTMQALGEAQQRLRWAQEAGRVGVFEVDSRGVLRGTPEFCRLYGLEECEEKRAVEFERLIIPEDRALVSDLQSRASGTAPLDVEYRIRRADDGELRWIARRGEIQRDDAGTPIGFAGVALDITERVRDRHALATERELLAQMFEQAPTFMALLEGPEHRFARANPGYMRLVGGREVVGRTVTEALPEAAGQGFIELLDQVYRSGKPYAADGQLFESQPIAGGPVDKRYVNFVYQPIHDADGTVTGIFVEGADVTDRTLAAEAAAAADERYRTVMTAIDVGFCVLEMKFEDGRPVDYKIVEGNPAFERQTGLVGAAGKWVSEIAPGLEAHWFELYGKVATTGEPAHFENPADVLGRWYDVRALRIGDPDAHRVAVFFSDISDRKRMEERLHDLNATLAEQVETRTQDRDRMWRLSTDVMMVADFDAAVAAVNPAWTTLLGWDADELIGKDFLSLVHPDDVEPTLTEVANLASGATTLRFINRYRHRDGHYLWLSWTAVPDDKFIHAVGRDITAERDQAEALAKTEEALRQAQKMEAVGQLTGGIAHDFNNMLTGVIGSLDLIQRNLANGKPERVDRYIDAATTSAQRAAALTARLLAFGRRQSLDLQPTDVNTLVSGMEDLLQRTLGEQVSLETHLATNAWAACTDVNQLESALLNLCINARDAMPDGGKLTIETRNERLDERYAREHAEVEPGDYVALSVSDTGIGMTPATLEKVFEPFFTTKPVGQGTGLGLSMIYGFARQSGGHVRIYSELGQGTTIKLYVPRYRGEVEVGGDQAAETPLGSGETVMVVEDDPSVRLIVLEVLEELGYRAIEAIDARHAIPILQSTKRIDLLVSDVGLPGMNGRQLAEVARETRPGLRVLFITGYAQNAAVRGGFLDHGMDMMTKPFAIDALATKIQQMLRDDRERPEPETSRRG